MNRWTWAGLVMFGALAFGCVPAGRDCGDRFCDSRFETAGSCPVDCGGSVCGDRTCEAGENCSVCPTDCGACGGCGDGLCQASTGETCGTCPGDCGACGGCGDGICGGGEGCSTCPGDCGSCSGCGDGSCGAGESCSTCPGDCGSCGTTADPYESCGGSTTCRASRDLCTAITNRGTTRSMCTVSSCSSDSDCDTDMFGSLGDCVSFAGSAATCFHRCVSSSDCYPGFACYPATGASGALGNICLPDAGPSVAPYRQCTTSSDCAGGLLCINYRVGTGNEDLCSTSPCVNDDDCPFDSRGGRGACLTFGGGVRACWERCNVRGDCANTVDFDCTTNVGGSTAPVLVCVPR